jgi:hypothetical protein
MNNRRVEQTVLDMLFAQRIQLAAGIRAKLLLHNPVNVRSSVTTEKLSVDL